MADKTNPAHYGKGSPYETIKVIDAWFEDSKLPPMIAALLFNTIKYIARAGKKEGETILDDLRKARWYLDFAIGWLEGRQKRETSSQPCESCGARIGQHCEMGCKRMNRQIDAANEKRKRRGL